MDRDTDPPGPPQRRRGLGGATGAGALLVGGMVGLVAIVSLFLALRTEGGNPAGAPSAASGPFFLDLRTGGRTPLPADLAGAFLYAASPDGARIAASPCCDPSDVVSVANIDGTQERAVGTPEGFASYLGGWSPDGSKIVYQELTIEDDISVGNLFIENASTGDREQLTDLGITRAFWWHLFPSFTPDGRSVVFHLPRNRSDRTKWDVWTVPVIGGEPSLLLRRAFFPMVLPSGTQIAYLSQAVTDPVGAYFGGHRLSVASLRDPTTSRTLVASDHLIWWPALSPDGSRIAYQVGGTIHVVEVSSGVSTGVTDGDLATWLDDHTLIVVP